VRRIAVLALLLAAAGTGCAGGLWSSARRPDIGYRVLSKLTAPVIPPPGVLYGDVHAPLVPAHTRVGTKKGTATAHQIGLPPLPYPGLAMGLDLFAWGDASIEAARKDGSIADVGYVDYRMQTFVFVYRRFTIEAYGD
jgi:TRL-like protein family